MNNKKDDSNEQSFSYSLNKDGFSNNDISRETVGLVSQI